MEQRFSRGEDMCSEEHKNKAFNKAIRLLGYRQRSTAELTERLRKAHFASEVIDETVRKLTNLGYLNDLKFTESWVLNRINVSGFGKTRIKHELFSKGIDKETVEQVFSELYSEEEDFHRACELAKKQLVLYCSLDYETKKRRLGGYLSRRGFPANIVAKACQKTLNHNHAD